jgi:hypothetical protein
MQWLGMEFEKHAAREGPGAMKEYESLIGEMAKLL